MRFLYERCYGCLVHFLPFNPTNDSQLPDAIPSKRAPKHETPHSVIVKVRGTLTVVVPLDPVTLNVATLVVVVCVLHAESVKIDNDKTSAAKRSRRFFQRLRISKTHRKEMGQVIWDESASGIVGKTSPWFESRETETEMEELWEELKLTLFGVTVQLTLFGSPEQPRDTMPEKPLFA
jgi:hypothetical protein